VFITIFPKVGSSQQPTLAEPQKPSFRMTRDLSSTKLTDKSKGVHHLVQDDENFPSPPDDKPLVIEDNNAVFYYLKQLLLPSNVKDIGSKIFDMVVRKVDVV